MKFFKSTQTPEEKELDPSGGMNGYGVFAVCGACLLGALALAPQLGSSVDRMIASVIPEYGIDRTTTAGVKPTKSSKTKRYIESRSVLNKDPSKPCIVKFQGMRGPNC